MSSSPTDILRKIALSFPETIEEPHFEKSSFRVRKKIFATVANNLATLKLSVIDQDVFSLIDNTIIYPVPNKWGNKGWTHVDLEKVDEEVLKDVLRHAYCEVAPVKLRREVEGEAE